MNGPLSQLAPVDSLKTRMCSCSAAMRFGHDLKRHGDLRADRRAHDVVGLGLLDVLSESGRTSQNDSVKSNGVCEIAQKLA